VTREKKSRMRVYVPTGSGGQRSHADPGKSGTE
jgi:hypothetical protein